MGIFKRHGVFMCVEVTGIKVDHIGEHRIAPLFGVEGQHLAYGAGLAEREEQVFGVEAVIEPCAGGRGNDLIDRLDEVGAGDHVEINPLYPLRYIIGQREGLGDQDQNLFEPRIEVMADGGINLNIVFDKDHRHRPFGQKRFLLREERFERGVLHLCPSTVGVRIGEILTHCKRPLS